MGYFEWTKQTISCAHDSWNATQIRLNFITQTRGWLAQLRKSMQEKDVRVMITHVENRPSCKWKWRSTEIALLEKLVLLVCVTNWPNENNEPRAPQKELYIVDVGKWGSSKGKKLEQISERNPRISNSAKMIKVKIEQRLDYFGEIRLCHRTKTRLEKLSFFFIFRVKNLMISKFG